MQPLIKGQSTPKGVVTHKFKTIDLNSITGVIDLTGIPCKKKSSIAPEICSPEKRVQYPCQFKEPIGQASRRNLAFRRNL